MELFEPRLASAYLWSCSEKKDRAFPPKLVYRPTRSPAFDQLAVDHHQIGSYPVGRYDEIGRWCTYCPPIAGIHGGLERYVLHPLAEDFRLAVLSKVP